MMMLLNVKIPSEKNNQSFLICTIHTGSHIGKVILHKRNINTKFYKILSNCYLWFTLGYLPNKFEQNQSSSLGVLTQTWTNTLTVWHNDTHIHPHTWAHFDPALSHGQFPVFGVLRRKRTLSREGRGGCSATQWRIAKSVIAMKVRFVQHCQSELIKSHTSRVSAC